MPPSEEPIVIKRINGHAGHHGGAWKVAYADFVTALMALFIVLWLMNTSKPVQEAVGGYFRDPQGSGKESGTRLGGAGEAAPLRQQDMKKLKEDLLRAMGKVANFEKLSKLIELTVTPEGLQIEMMEDPNGTFFENGSPMPTEAMRSILKALSPEVGKLPNKVSIEGHTNSVPYSKGATYTNWELSADRANAARRMMLADGLRPNQVVEVRGFADQKLRKPKQPNDPSNRRVTVLIQYPVNPIMQKTVESKGPLPPVKEK
jgi:chemotaxis protein MotB